MTRTKITFLLNETDKDRLEELAHSRGLALSTFCRFILLKELKLGGINAKSNN